VTRPDPFASQSWPAGRRRSGRGRSGHGGLDGQRQFVGRLEAHADCFGCCFSGSRHLVPQHCAHDCVLRVLTLELTKENETLVSIVVTSTECWSASAVRQNVAAVDISHTGKSRRGID
jgi:hypothetical protein